MVDRAFVVAVLAGIVLALPYLAFVRGHRRPAIPLAAGLFIAALIYLPLVAIRADASAGWLEATGLFAFGVLALAGARLTAWLLVAGWSMHVGWDLLLHPVGDGGYVPGWYPALCVGFDILVAGYALALVLRPRESLQ